MHPRFLIDVIDNLGPNCQTLELHTPAFDLGIGGFGRLVSAIRARPGLKIFFQMEVAWSRQLSDEGAAEIALWKSQTNVTWTDIPEYACAEDRQLVIDAFDSLFKKANEAQPSEGEDTEDDASNENDETS
jgi:hypothetical protein